MLAGDPARLTNQREPTHMLMLLADPSRETQALLMSGRLDKLDKMFILS
jgi:hypothetical protein